MVRTSLEGLYPSLENRVEFRWIHQRIQSMDEIWVEAGRSLSAKNNLTERRAKHVMCTPPSMLLSWALLSPSCYGIVTFQRCSLPWEWWQIFHLIIPGNFSVGFQFDTEANKRLKTSSFIIRVWQTSNQEGLHTGPWWRSAAGAERYIDLQTWINREG